MSNVEIYPDKEIRRRLTVSVGNPIVKTHENVLEFNQVCELVKAFDLFELILGEDNVKISLYYKRKTIKYPRAANVEWLKNELQKMHDTTAYENAANAKNVNVFKQSRSAQAVNAISYALGLPDVVVNRQDDSIVLTSSTLTYCFNLNNLTIKDNKKVQDMLKIKRLEALIKERNL